MHDLASFAARQWAQVSAGRTACPIEFGKNVASVYRACFAELGQAVTAEVSGVLPTPREGWQLHEPCVSQNLCLAVEPNQTAPVDVAVSV